MGYGPCEVNNNTRVEGALPYFRVPAAEAVTTGIRYPLLTMQFDPSLLETETHFAVSDRVASLVDRHRPSLLGRDG